MKAGTVMLLKLIMGLTLATACLFGQSTPKTDSSSGIVLRGRQTIWPSQRLRPVALPDGRMVVSIEDSVYMLAPDGKQLWKYQQQTLAAEPAFNPARNEIAVVMYDLVFVRLDATTGEIKWTAPSVGRGAFTSVAAYDKGFLVVVDMSGYRNKLGPTVPDRLEYWGDSDNDSWGIDFPQHAELVVNGAKIFALLRHEDELRLKQLHAPGLHAE